MVKKSLIVGLTAIILSLCCGLCFAAEGNNETSVNLGNEITSSVDKAGQSMQNLTDNVFSTNTADEMRTDTRNMGNSVMDGMTRVDDGIVNATGTNNRDNTGNNDGNNNGNNNENNNGNNAGNNNGNNNGNNKGENAGDYNATRTTAEGTGTTGFNTMSTTTWMWIILAVAAIIIIAAIWYYATQSNDK